MPDSARDCGFFLVAQVVILGNTVVATQFNHLGASPRRFLIRPNCSLSWRNAVRFYLGIFAVSFGIAIGFALKGAWLVLPFAGLEMLVLGIAMYVVARRSGNWQEIAISGDRISIVEQNLSKVHQESIQRTWAKVVFEPPPIRGHASRLCIRSHGRSVEVGGCLNEEEKRFLAEQLGQALR